MNVFSSDQLYLHRMQYLNKKYCYHTMSGAWDQVEKWLRTHGFQLHHKADIQLPNIDSPLEQQ